MRLNETTGNVTSNARTLRSLEGFWRSAAGITSTKSGTTRRATSPARNVTHSFLDVYLDAVVAGGQQYRVRVTGTWDAVRLFLTTCGPKPGVKFAANAVDADTMILYYAYNIFNINAGSGTPLPANFTLESNAATLSRIAQVAGTSSPAGILGAIQQQQSIITTVYTAYLAELNTPAPSKDKSITMGFTDENQLHQQIAMFIAFSKRLKSSENFTLQEGVVNANGARVYQNIMIEPKKKSTAKVDIATKWREFLAYKMKVIQEPGQGDYQPYLNVSNYINNGRTTKNEGADKGISSNKKTAIINFNYGGQTNTIRSNDRAAAIRFLSDLTQQNYTATVDAAFSSIESKIPKGATVIKYARPTATSARRAPQLGRPEESAIFRSGVGQLFGQPSGATSQPSSPASSPLSSGEIE